MQLAKAGITLISRSMLHLYVRIIGYREILMKVFVFIPNAALCIFKARFQERIYSDGLTDYN